MREIFGNDTNVAEVDGEDIDVRDYQQRVKDYEILYNFSSQGRGIDDATRAQINTQALRELVSEKLINKEAEKLGIMTTKEEEKDLIYSAEPDPFVRQYPIFTNEETRQFDPQRIKMFEQQVDQIDPTGKMKEEWETIKAYVIRNNVNKKYNSLLMHSIYMPSYLIKHSLNEQTSIASIRYVKVPYTTIQDAEVKVTEDELKAYMKKRAPLYTIKEPTRSMDYVSFMVLPSAEDTSKSLGALNELKNEFVTTTDNESFINRNSEEQYVNAFVNKKSFMSMYSDSIMNMSAGSVFGPYFENGSYKLTKVVERRTLPDSVKARHILIKTKERGQELVADSIAKRRIDSAVAAINSGASFDTMVLAVSQDDGSKATGGEYTFTLQQRSQLSKEFGDFAFEGSKGEKKVVKVDNDAYAGYHYIEILDQSGMAPAVKLANVSKSLYPGDKTDNATYAQASEFAGQNNNGKAFDEAVKNRKLDKRVAENLKVHDFMIPGLGSAREMIKWAYDAKVGDVSPVFALNGNYVVAKLSSKKEEGLMELDANLRPVIEASVRNEKKAKILADKYKSSASLDAMAQAANQPVLQADSFNAAQAFIPAVGYEPKVVGYAFFKNFQLNALSPVINGQDGIFRINLTFRGNKPAADESVVAQMKMMQGMQLRNSLIGSLEEIMRERADVSYNSKNL